MIDPLLSVAEAARSYIGAGLSVLPIHGIANGRCTCGDDPCTRGAGKHPSTRGGEWLAYQARRATDDELAQWFGGPDPRNVAIITGEISGNLLVIDCDDSVTYQALLWAYPALRATLTVRSGKGWHLYLRSPEPVRTVKFQANGLMHHVKFNGQYIVAPPSNHSSGNVYRFVDPGAPIATVDLERLRSALRRIAASPPDDRVRNAPGWAAEALRSACPSGQRDDTAARIAGYLNHYQVPSESIEAILELWAEGRCDQRPDPFGPRQVERIVRSITRR